MRIIARLLILWLLGRKHQQQPQPLNQPLLLLQALKKATEMRMEIPMEK